MNMTKFRLFTLAALLLLLCVGMVHYVSISATENNLKNSSIETIEPDVQPISTVTDGITTTEQYILPVSGSAPTKNVKHTIDLTEIRQGCFRQDCIPSVDSPKFVAAAELADVLEKESLGIYIAAAERFYPFPMLETKEIVNDTLPDGSAVAVTYCPLCGTGIVFNRETEEGVLEFGVSGMLWQSNLLMYNRADSIQDQNLWSQVLGQAVVGNRAGEELEVVPSDVITFADWLERSPEGITLNTGTPRDPYGGDYYETAKRFSPDFSLENSPLEPMTRVHGIIVDGLPKAYVSDQLTDGLSDFVGQERVFVRKEGSTISFISSNAESGQAPTEIPDVEGFWFSWVAAHPDTELWRIE